MPKLVPISAQRMVKILKRLGFEETRTKGSHHFFLNPISKKSTTIPIHSNEILGVGILKLILRDIDLSTDEYDKLRLRKQ
ncbi:MAG: type II toxin-antitoxin system HicA family toxin [bacterium]|nr:type II toxin-antitoxin system HicA family toxin [bacterium]